MLYATAVKTIAGPSPRGGLAIADKVQTAVNAVRVAQALDAIAKILEEGTTTTSAKVGAGASIRGHQQQC